MANRLASATSPYLLQHADNPVDWWEWGPEAFEEARRRDIPLLLSVGYAACHWCHVMAHESFEDPEIGTLINERFVAIKVDREERADIDAVYMRATQMLTGSGGWPMTVFLDHEGRPFHAGTYYPPQDHRGMPSLRRVLAGMSEAWQQDRARVEQVAQQVAAAVRAADVGAPRPVIVTDPEVLTVLRQPTRGGWPTHADGALADLAAAFDPVHGGFGGAPKFPPGMVIEFLLRHHARTGDPKALAMADQTCRAMARGGMYDQLGGGFARYSVDAGWVVPHFEKMLYDNVLLARVYLHLWRATGAPLAERVVRETCDFLLRDLCTPQGGFASSLDADSGPVLPGQQPEGAYYVWSPEQLREVLGQQAREVGTWLSVTDLGTFERGTSVLQLLADPPVAWRQVRSQLLAARTQRPRPARDDKIIAGWNGLALAALAEAGLLLGEPRYTQAAVACAQLLADVHLSGDRLLRVSRDGAVGAARGLLEDYGGMAEGFLALYQAGGEVRWLDGAASLLTAARRSFGDGRGGFFDTAGDAEPLLTRPRDPSDNATPSGWALVTGALVTLGALTGDTETRSAAEASMTRLLAHPVAEQARFFGWGLAVLEAMIAGPLEVAVIGEVGGPLHRAAAAGTSPGLVVAAAESGASHPALLANRGQVAGSPAAYVCRNFTCELPTTDADALSLRVR